MVGKEEKEDSSERQWEGSGVIKAMKDINIEIDYMRLEYPSVISTYQVEYTVL